MHAADDVLLGHESPMPAVRAVVAVIAHDEVIAVINPLRTEVVVAAILGRHEVVGERNVVHVDATVHDPNLVAFFGDDPLDE